MTEPVDPYDQIIMAVGEVCFWWSSLEHLIHDIVLHLAVALDPAFDKESPRNILHLTLASLDIRGKIVTAKALAHQIDEIDSPGFYDRVEELLNYVDNELRPERNRYVHDNWSIAGSAAMRMRLAPKITRPQARQRDLTMWSGRRYPSITAALAFVKNLQLADGDLVQLDNHIAWMVSQRDLQPGSPQPLLPEWQSLAHRDWREPSKR